MKTKRSTLIKLISLLAFAPALLSATAFTDAVDNGDGSFTSWFGTFSTDDGMLPTSDTYIDHEEHGRLYLHIYGNGFWAWDPNIESDDTGEQYFYTSRTIYPWCFFTNPEGSAFWARFIVGVPAAGPESRIFVRGAQSPYLLSKRETRNLATLAGDAGLSTLVTAVGAADPAVPAALTGDGPLTVFAPTNEAFAAISDTVNTLLMPENQGMLTDVLLYHVAPGELTASDLTYDLDDIFSGESNTLYLTTANGADLKIDATPMGVYINDTSMVVTPNVMAANGIVHVISEVLIPPGDLATVATEAGFSQLVGAVGAADPAVLAALTGDSPLTVFAPVNEAFEDIAGTVAGLSQAQLTNVLLYHVVPGKIYASEVPLDTPVGTAQGSTVTFTSDTEGNLYVNGAKIIATNVTASNGVVHVIDSVILPPAP